MKSNAKKPSLIDFLLSLLPFLITLAWGNIPALVILFPIVGGIAGAAIGLTMMSPTVFLLRRVDSLIPKLICAAITSLIAIVLSHIVAIAALGLF